MYFQLEHVYYTYIIYFTGIKIIATVCDQSATNIAALKSLRVNTERQRADTGYERMYLLPVYMSN